MTTYQGVAAVTQAIRYLVETGIRAVVPEASTSLESPERQALAARDDPRVSIYLVQVVADAVLRNTDLPTRAADGGILASPKAALNLRYLLTFFGPAATAQLMLGRTELVLRQHAYLDPALVADSALDHAHLRDARLDEQRPPVVLNPVAMSLEELSRVWSGFFQVPYTLSTTYEASGLLLESDVDPAVTVPVRDVDVDVELHVR